MAASGRLRPLLNGGFRPFADVQVFRKRTFNELAEGPDRPSLAFDPISVGLDFAGDSSRVDRLGARGFACQLNLTPWGRTTPSGTSRNPSILWV